MFKYIDRIYRSLFHCNTARAIYDNISANTKIASNVFKHKRVNSEHGKTEVNYFKKGFSLYAGYYEIKAFELQILKEDFIM